MLSNTLLVTKKSNIVITVARYFCNALLSSLHKFIVLKLCWRGECRAPAYSQALSQIRGVGLSEIL